MPDQPHDLDAKSLAMLQGVHPDLVKVVKLASQTSTVSFRVIEGVRSDEQAYINWGKGRPKAELLAKGVPVRFAQPELGKVTWVSNPLNTKHRKQPDGFGHAVDLLPAPYDWKALAPFDAVAKAMLEAANDLHVGIRWGANWNANGTPREAGETDNPHFELAPIAPTTHA